MGRFGKYVFIVLIIWSFVFGFNQIYANDILDFIKDNTNKQTITKDDMLVGEKQTSLIPGLGSKNGADLTIGQDNNISLMQILKSIQNYILAFVGIITIGTFIYIGARLVMAEGKQEEFNKAMKAIIYVVLGLAIIPLSYIVIKIVTGLNF
ncbi:hypothetical protein KAZ01_00630 [Candidatus Gracilibacteria bacterium]|nr:hypothetical protein [Candidatus Gracilibacteria bacterium]